MNNQSYQNGKHQSTAHSAQSSEMINVGQTERTVSLVSGAALTTFGVILALARRNPVGALVALLGGGMLYRAATGHSPTFQTLGVNTAVKTNKDNVSVPHEQGVHVTSTVTINHPVEDLYRFWRNLENLPRIMSQLESVEVLNDKRSRWTAKGPAGMSVSWESEIINEVENEVIGWRSLENSQIANAGAVRFTPSANGQQTEVKIEMEYVPPAGNVGVAVAKLFNQDPQQQTDDDLRRFKQHVESGTIAFEQTWHPTTGNTNSR